MFKTVFRHHLVLTLREKVLLFWSLAFPLIMATLFFLAFSNLGNSELINKPIKLAFVSSQTGRPGVNLQTIMQQIPLKEGSTQQLFDLQAMSLEEARQAVQDNKVDAAVVDGQTPQVMAGKVRPNQVVAKMVVDQIATTGQVVASLMQKNPAMNPVQAAARLNQTDYVEPMSLNQDRMKPDIIYYFALLAMTCLGACSAGAMVVVMQQANKSAGGARMAISPANKWLRVSASGLATYLIQLALSLVVVAFVTLVLGKHLGDNLPFILLLVSTGTLMGFLMGMAIACLVRGSQNVILGITTGVYLLSSFLTGLMSDQVKRMVDLHLPLLGRLNPGSMIVNAFHSLYYYQQNDYSYLLHMLLACLVFAGVVVLTLGRKYHDSL